VGAVVKTTGDGILIEFPSVVDAVRCAMDVQRGMAERTRMLQMSNGSSFASGSTSAHHDRCRGHSWRRREYRGRLESIAEPGGICISDSSYQQVRDKLTIHSRIWACSSSRTSRVRCAPIAYRLAGARQGKGRRSLCRTSPRSRYSPFQNMSGDPEQEYFADGMVEDIITD